MKKKVLCFLLGGAVMWSGCASTLQEQMQLPITHTDNTAQWEEAKTTPYRKYPELVTYTLGKMTGTNNSNMPEGDTYEDNVYTRYLMDLLNIQNTDAFEATDAQYSTNVTMAMASGKLPDVMVVDNYEDLALLVEADMIEDLSEAYENCASDMIKEIYASYGDSIFNNVMFDGKLMAIPETNISDGPNLLWLRKDWLDELNLSEPKTLADVETIVRAFMEEHPGNAAGETTGLICSSTLTGEKGYSYEYLVDIVFANFGAYPKHWIENDNGEVVYGSVQPEVKNALRFLNRWYNEGILDKDFLLRTSSNLIELIVQGKCGAFFGPWWAPNNPLCDAMQAESGAEWRPYLISTDGSGVTTYCNQSPSYKYVVVRKGYAHPELVVKQISALFDYATNDLTDTTEMEQYFQQNVDPTARPLAINVDFNDALMRCYDGIKDVMAGRRSADTLSLVERAYYQSCKLYMESQELAGIDEWAAYASRIEACSLIAEGNIEKKESLFFGTTETMKSEWWKLKVKEQNTFLQIITGDKDISYFDQFVTEWNNEGGNAITQEVRIFLDEKNAAEP